MAPISSNSKYYSLLVCLVLALLHANPAEAKKTKVNSVYFNTENSIVLEADGDIKYSARKKFGEGESGKQIYVLEFSDASLANKINNTLESNKFKVQFKEHQSNGFFFFKNSKLEAQVESLEQQELVFAKREILEGEAYEISFVSEDTSSEYFANVTKKEAPEEVMSKGETLKLSAKENVFDFFEFDKSKTETKKFLKELDNEFIVDNLAAQGFQEEKLKKVDSTNMALIAAELAKQGNKEQALEAYRKSIEINPNNTEARMSLAKLTDDRSERLENYIKTVDTEAVASIGEDWLDIGVETGNSKVVAAALVSLQYAILKEPLNPELRLKYAQALEKSGEDFYSEAAKRYTEAASLSKKEFFTNGKKSAEPLMRSSVENLIRLLVVQGEFAKAAKYCERYLGMGYKTFAKGDPIQRILKSIKKNKNPFGF